jgi:hypothetical protein
MRQRLRKSSESILRLRESAHRNIREAPQKPAPSIPSPREVADRSIVPTRIRRRSPPEIFCGGGGEAGPTPPIKCRGSDTPEDWSAIAAGQIGRPTSAAGGTRLIGSPRHVHCFLNDPPCITGKARGINSLRSHVSFTFGISENLSIPSSFGHLRSDNGSERSGVSSAGAHQRLSLLRYLRSMSMTVFFR